MKVSIKLEYKDKVYNSDFNKITEEEKNELTDLIECVVQGKVAYLTFKKDNQNFYFSKKILEESILTLSNTIE
jgi:phosphoribosylformylglycinamidine (FGAM) synthase PurS component